VLIPVTSHTLSHVERKQRLQNRKEVEWASKNVTLLFGDMRSIDIPELADILVSELLGSFGDNELSPECLDGAVRFLKGESPHLHSHRTVS
jgi:type II protein arginine methyltransferase